LAIRIEYKKSVARDLKKIVPDEVKRILAIIEENLPEQAEQCFELKGKFKGLRRFRIGEYCVIFVLPGERMIILRIGHRKGVYRD
jgi:mRNA interferase RelE/StbE